MATNELKVRNKGVVHTTDEWTNSSNSNYKGNVTLNKGELAFTEKDGIVTDMKIGDGSSKWGNIPYYLIYPNIKPIIEKTYTGVTCTANSDPAAWLYFGNILPDSYTEQWEITYRIYATMSGSTESNISYVKFTGIRNAIVTWAVYNSITNGNYRAYHNHLVYRAKEAGVTNKYGHALGLRFQSSWNPNVADNARTIKVEIMDMKRCSFTIYNSMLLYANIPGTGTTNYDGRNEYDGISNGFKSNGDNNDITTMQLANMHLTAGTNGLKQYSLCMMDQNGTYQSFTTNNGTGTKTKNTVGFLLGHIFYLNMGGNVAAGAVTGYNVVRTYQSGVDFRYSSNCGTGLTANKMVYIVGTFNKGLFYLADTWWTQTIPTTADGKIYIPVGMAYNTYGIDFMGYKGAYFYDGHKIVASELPPLTEEFSGDSDKAIIMISNGSQLKLRGISDTTNGASGNSSFTTANSLYNTMITANRSEETNPESETWYSLPFINTSDTLLNLRYNDSLKFYISSNKIYFQLGSSTRKGVIRLYDNSNHYADIAVNTLSSNMSWALPNSSGSLLVLNSWTNNVSSSDDGYYLSTTVKLNDTKYYVYGKDFGRIKAEEYNPDDGSVNYLTFIGNTNLQQPKYNTGVNVQLKKGTTSAAGTAYLYLGKADATNGHQEGQFRLFSTNGYYANVRTYNLSSDVALSLPNKTGTIALVDSDIVAISVFPGNKNLNDIAKYGNAIGYATNVTSTDSTVNPSGTVATDAYTFLNMSYKITGQSSYYITQIANKAGTTDLWVRSRNGGAITNGTAWAAPWTRILTSNDITVTSPIVLSKDATTQKLNISHGNSGVTAGNYGDNAAQTPAYGGTFSVPYIEVNSTGHITKISSHTVKIPASDNTNTTYTYFAGVTGGTAKVTTNTNDPYLILRSSANANQEIQLKAGTNVTSIVANNNVITFNVKDTTYTSLKNPYALSFKANDASSNTDSYDGSTAKTINIKNGGNMTIACATSSNVITYTITGTANNYDTDIAATNTTDSDYRLLLSTAATDIAETNKEPIKANGLYYNNSTKSLTLDGWVITKNTTTGALEFSI